MTKRFKPYKGAQARFYERPLPAQLPSGVRGAVSLLGTATGRMPSAGPVLEGNVPKPRTGWPPGMLQDDDAKLSKWLAERATRFQVDSVVREINASAGKSWVAGAFSNIDYVDAEARVLAHMRSDPRWKELHDSWYFDESSTFTLAQWAALHTATEWDNWKPMRDIV